MKTCTKCKKEKSLSEFHKDRSKKTGFDPRCKECIKNYKQKYHQTIIGCLRHRFKEMKQRCDNPKCKRYKDWGGRGIKVKFTSANEFVNYVINELKIDPHGLTIDRIDNDGNYEKGNIRIVTIKENNNNRRKRTRCGPVTL